MSNDGFIQLTRALSTNPDWLNARPTHQAIFIAIVLRMAFKETEQDFNGHKVKVKPCQLYVSQMKLAEWTNKWITKDDVEGALKYFARCNFLLHQVLHKKSLITVTNSEVCETFLRKAPPKSTPVFLHASSTKEEREEREQEDHHPNPSSLNHGLTDDFSFSKTTEEAIVVDDASLAQAGSGHTYEPSKHNIHHQSARKTNPKPDLIPKIEIVPGILLTQEELDECITDKGSREAVESAIRAILASPKRKYEIKDWPNTLATWEIKPNVLNKVKENESMAKRLASQFVNFPPNGGWRCYIYTDKKKDQRGLLFESSGQFVAPYFIALSDSDFKEKASKFIRENKMQKGRVL